MSTRFADLPHTPQEHFKLCFYETILRLRERLTEFPPPADPAPFAFLGGYFEELERVGFPTGEAEAVTRWERERRRWERGAEVHLPLVALSEAAALDDLSVSLLLVAGIVEEDPRFGLLFDALQGSVGQHRPTVGLLTGWWPEGESAGAARASLRRLVELGIATTTGDDLPRSERTLQVPPVLWDALRGDRLDEIEGWARYLAPEQLTRIGDLVVPDALGQTIAEVPALLASREVRTLILRGPRSAGRRTVLGALAAANGYGLLELGAVRDCRDERWRLAGPLATILHAVPVVELDLAPAETAELERPPALAGALGLAVGRQGGIGGRAVEASLTLTLGLPAVGERRAHWVAGLGTARTADVDGLARRFRMTGGNIRRTARLARAEAALAGRDVIDAADVRRASRALGRQTLDTLAARVDTAGSWADLAVDPTTMDELRLLESRCRHREELQDAVGDSAGAGVRNAGVRALFTGPSGTGKTLAARLLASVLEIDLYRLDLSTVVNKYLGETEKNLSQVFARAEELDVALLLDEGDALLTQRTDVGTAHDRYANLETNYLLQRLETFEGILIVTTNASDRIDAAFQRRMDVVVEFRAPNPAERWAIWQLHLPSPHVADAILLDEIAVRCALTGGQIQNAATHASLLALDDGGLITSQHLETAVRREYRKAGGVCPLRAPTEAVPHR